MKYSFAESNFDHNAVSVSLDANSLSVNAAIINIKRCVLFRILHSLWNKYRTKLIVGIKLIRIQKLIRIEKKNCLKVWYGLYLLNTKSFNNRVSNRSRPIIVELSRSSIPESNTRASRSYPNFSEDFKRSKPIYF